MSMHIRRKRIIGSYLVVAAALLAGCRMTGRDDEPEASVSCTSEEGTPPVRWIRAAPAAEGTELDRWCATVGPPVLMAGMPTPSAPLDSLVVVSWNVHVGGGSIPELVAALRSGRLTGGTPPAHFALLLQEAYRGGPLVPPPSEDVAADIPHRIAPLPPEGTRFDVVAIARRLGLWLVYVPSMRNGPGLAAPREDRGNAILSTLPLEDPSAIELPLETQRRVAVTAWVSGRTAAGAVWRVRLVSAHLDHRGPWMRPLSSFGPARLAQARALADALAGPRHGARTRSSPAAAPTVIGSDLNTWSLRSLESAVPYLHSFFPSGPPEPRGATFSVAGIGRRLDHVFFRIPSDWSARTRIVPDRFGSDHNPMVAVLRTSERGRPTVASGDE